MVVRRPTTSKQPVRSPKPPTPIRPPDRSVSTALEKLLGSVELDEGGATKAAIARALATKLDQAVLTDSGPVAMSVAGISKELRECIDAILESTGDVDGFVADLFAPVGDP